MVGIAVILTAVCAMMKVKVKRKMGTSGIKQYCESHISYLVFFSFLFLVVFQSRKSSNSKSNNAKDAIELKKCGAYEVNQLAKQRVGMKQNPAYGEVGTFI